MSTTYPKSVRSELKWPFYNSVMLLFVFCIYCCPSGFLFFVFFFIVCLFFFSLNCCEPRVVGMFFSLFFLCTGRKHHPHLSSSSSVRFSSLFYVYGHGWCEVCTELRPEKEFESRLVFESCYGGEDEDICCWRWCWKFGEDGNNDGVWRSEGNDNREYVKSEVWLVVF